MSDMTAHPTSPGETFPAGAAAFFRRHPVMRLALWRLPSAAMLLLALGGVAYTSLSPRPTAHYWQLLTPVFGLICIASEWKKTHAEARWRLVWTQTLHWGAVLLAMRILFFPDIQRMMNSDATGLMVLGLLALGTVLAGVHAAAWEVAAVGVILALAIPAVALLEQTALLLLLGCLAIMAGAALFFWLRAKLRRLRKPHVLAPTSGS
jgi:hypothetical protein